MKLEMIKQLTAMPKYEAYKDSEVEWLGEIPAHWHITRLGTRFEERRQKVSDKDFPPLSVTKNGILPQLETAAKTNDGDNRKLVKKGDFVINSRSDRKGSSGVSDRDGSVSLINIVLEPKGIQPQYCQYLLKSYAFIEEFYRMGHGIVADLWTTRYDEMKAVIMGVPPFTEQTAIAAFLDRKTTQIDQAMAIKEKQIALLKERKQILIQNAVTRGLNPDAPMRDSGVEWIGKIPAHWQIKRLRLIGNTQNGISAGADYFGSGYPFVSYGDVYNNRELPIAVKGLAKSSDEDRKQYSIVKGDVLFTRTSETIEEIGFASVCMKTILNSTFAGFLIRFRPKTRELFEGFSKYYFNAPMLRLYFVKEMNLVIRASLSQELLKNLPVLLPPFDEQKIIYDHIETESAKIDRAISIQQQQIDKLKEYKTTLINSAVTGKIRVPGLVESSVPELADSLVA
jgi:type I restriction enzyme S subunit